MILSVLCLLLPMSQAIGPQEKLEVEHGEMIVVYQSKKNQHTLSIIKKSQKGKKELPPGAPQTRFKTSGDEFVSIDMGFECQTPDNEYAYAVASRQMAREDLPFPAKKAWVVKEEDFKLEKATNPYAIRCQFDKSSKKDYPFPPE